MDPMQVAERYFDAWNRRDATAIVASFASGGTYSDPSAGGVLEIRELSGHTVVEMLSMEGFIGWVGMTVGHRLMTVTAWESPDNPRQLLQGGTHKEAMTRFFGSTGLGRTGVNSVWIPERIGALRVRCDACGHMVDSAKAEGTCDCGAALPEAMAYW